MGMAIYSWIVGEFQSWILRIGNPGRTLGGLKDLGTWGSCAWNRKLSTGIISCCVSCSVLHSFSQLSTEAHQLGCLGCGKPLPDPSSICLKHLPLSQLKRALANEWVQFRLVRSALVTSVTSAT